LNFYKKAHVENGACYFYKEAQKRAISAVGNTCIIVLRIYLGVTFEKMIKIGQHLTKLLHVIYHDI